MRVNRILLVSFGLICLFQGKLLGQKSQADLFHDAEGNTFHQLFLDFQATEIIEINYANDSTPIKGELTSDGFSVVIKNYTGDKSVKLKVLDASGQPKEVIKSRCFIDPVLMHL